MNGYLGARESHDGVPTAIHRIGINPEQENEREVEKMILECSICKSTENLQGHHISYEPEEIQILCVSCHLEMHGKRHGVGVSNNIQKQIPENFEELWKTKTYSEIIDICKISCTTIYLWGKKFNLLPKTRVGDVVKETKLMRIKEQTWKRLKELGKIGETFDDIINRVCLLRTQPLQRR